MKRLTMMLLAVGLLLPVMAQDVEVVALKRLLEALKVPPSTLC